MMAGAAAGAAPSYRAIAARRAATLVAAAAVLAGAVVVDVLTGPAFLDIADVLRALVAPSTADPTVVIIVWDLRLPMTLMAVLVGAALAVAGVAMQTILSNPLASPYTLGLSAAAGFGASLVILTGAAIPFAPGLTVPLAAFAAAGVATALVYALAQLRGVTADVMVLAGIATLFLFQSLQSLVQYLAAPEVLQAIVFWLFGSLQKASWDTVPITAAALAGGLAVLTPDLWRLTALSLGDDRAAALGVDVRRLRRKVFVVVTALTAGAVAFVGTIGFVGLVAPHIARGLVGEDQRLLTPMGALCGAIIMTGASILSKLISPGAVVPIGIVTAVIGVPFLFGLILRGRRGGA